MIKQFTVKEHSKHSRIEEASKEEAPAIKRKDLTEEKREMKKNGQPEKAEYRRFRIKFSEKPNDYLMLKEVLTRRFGNKWQTPDLIIIDGGKGQLNAATSIIGKLRFNIQTVSLAKRLEEIYTPNKILPVSLPKESPARQLAQAIRDEAHRFAITYHRHLRSKQFLEN